MSVKYECTIKVLLLSIQEYEKYSKVIKIIWKWKYLATGNGRFI